jgi:hypothetical protein
MRIALALVVLAVSTSACGLGGDDVSAKTREKEVVDAVDEALPLAQEAVGATETEVVGKWMGCPGGIGHRFEGGGTMTAPQGDDPAALPSLASALTAKGFSDETQVDGHVTVARGDVRIDFRAPGARDPQQWTVTFEGRCHTYSGDDETYVAREHAKEWRTLS